MATAHPERQADEEYCKEISQRAVARAALHLGVESMTSDTLHVLGDVLLSYMERVSSSFLSRLQSIEMPLSLTPQGMVTDLSSPSAFSSWDESWLRM